MYRCGCKIRVSPQLHWLLRLLKHCEASPPSNLPLLNWTHCILLCLRCLQHLRAQVHSKEMLLEVISAFLISVINLYLADVIFPAVCYMCVATASSLNLTAEIEYVCAFTTIPRGLDIGNICFCHFMLRSNPRKRQTRRKDGIFHHHFQGSN